MIESPLLGIVNFVEIARESPSFMDAGPWVKLFGFKEKFFRPPFSINLKGHIHFKHPGIGNTEPGYKLGLSKPNTGVSLQGFLSEILTKIKSFLTEHHFINIDKSSKSCHILEVVDVIFHGIHVTVDYCAFLVHGLPRYIYNVLVKLIPDLIELVYDPLLAVVKAT